ncbi:MULTISPECIES: hypothetical protein [Saccharothrix]|uniref:hypothetical protein n=1 Tax=Saccharothrix TaxID=2071 RepID=UPI00093A566F|nr:hypothetical protein [Saccharothrix sp. CB00851]OKI38928.1 hypothetical protein A6A25_01635 [Saccharothrix sp. CB00851]
MWLAVFFGASVLVALTPGANNLLGMHRGVHHGPLRASTALLGRLAAFSLMVDPARGPIPLQLATLGAVYLAAEALAGTAYVALGAGIRKAGLTRRAKARLDKGTAAVLFGMAGVLATSRT